MSTYIFPWMANYLAKQEAKRAAPVAPAANPARNGCTCECHNHPIGTIMHFMDCCPPTQEKNYDAN